MKTLILTLLFITTNSCDPVAKETVQNPVESAAENDAFNTMPSLQQNNPNEVTLVLKVMEVYESGKDICGASQKNVMKMMVQEIVESGSSIVNLPNKNDASLMNFILPPKDLSVNTVIEVKANEELCLDASKTYFTIISYKIRD